MNILLILVIAILVIAAVNGIKRGFIKMLFSTITMIAALIIALLAGPVFAKHFQANESLMNKLTTSIHEKLNLDQLAENCPDTTDFMESVNLPDTIKETIITEEFLEKVDISSTAKNASAELSQAVSLFLAKTIIYMICFVVIFIGSAIIITIIGNVLDLIAKLPILKQANKFAGLLLGLVQGVLVVWLLFAVITIISGTEFGQSVHIYITESQLLTFLYNNNLPLKLITGQVEGMF